MHACSSRRPCLRSPPPWAGRGNATARHSGRRGAGRLPRRCGRRTDRVRVRLCAWSEPAGLRPNVRKTDQARQHLETLGEAMKETDARTRAEMGRFRSAQRTPAYSLPAHANPGACSLPAHGHAVCQSCTRVSKGVGFQSLRAHALEPTSAWVRAISAQREDTPHHTKGARVIG
jgi:hypothetical protein